MKVILAFTANAHFASHPEAFSTNASKLNTVVNFKFGFVALINAPHFN